MSPEGTATHAGGSVTELLERARELTALCAAVEAAAAGQGRAVLIEGAAGIGKTSLLRRARELAEAAGFFVLAARGAELDRALAFGTLRRLLAPALRTLGDRLDGPAAPAATALGLNEGFGAPPDTGSVAHAIEWLLADLTEERPLLLLVDDLHWVDAESAQVLAHVAAHLDELPAMAVLATRPEPRVQPLVETVLRGARAIELLPAPLTVEGVEQLAAVVTGVARPAREFAAACREVSGGVPFLAHELLRELTEEGVRPEAAGVERVRAVAPRTVQRAVLVRVARCGEAARALAGALAILSPGVEPGLAAEVAEVAPLELPAALDELVGADVLRDGPELDFAHPMMRTAVREDIPVHVRAAIHERAADALTSRGAAAETIALHLLATPSGGDAARARTLHIAGLAALRAGAPETAATLLRRAAAEPPPPETRPLVLTDLGRACAAAGLPEALGHLRAAYEAAASPRARAAVAGDLADALAYEGGRAVEAAALLRAAAQELPERDDDRLGLIARLVLLSDRFDVLTHRTMDFFDLMPRGLRGTTSAQRACLTMLAIERVMNGTADEAREHIEPVVAHPELLDDDPHVRMTAIAIVRTVGDLQRAEALSAAAVKSVRHRARRGIVARSMSQHATLLWRLGRLPEAEAQSELAWQVVGGAAPTVDSQIVAAWLALVRVDRGRVADAEAVLESVCGRDVGSWYAEFPLLRARSAVAFALGRVQEAVDLQLRIPDVLARVSSLNPADVEWGHEAARMLAAQGRRDEALEVLERVAPVAARYGVPAAIGWLTATRGLVKRDPDLVRTGADILSRTDHRTARATALVDLGTVLRLEGRPREARDVLRAALEEARKLGAVALAARGEDELRAAGGRSVERVRHGADSLTPGELRICSLATAGHTNRQIAEQLYLTVKTVEMHLRNAYRKLGIASRQELPEALRGMAGV